MNGYQPYESDSDNGSDSELSVSSETSGTSADDRITHDGRMEAMDAWRSAAQSWISGPGRVAPAGALVRPLPVSATVPAPGGRPVASSPASAGALDLPLELRANDIRRVIVNIDSQFRDNPRGSTAGDFWIRLLSPLRNILRIRVTSIELPNNYKFFTAGRQYTTVTFVKGATTYTVTIPDGNYTAGDMVDALTAGAAAFLDLSGMTVEFSEITGKFTFCAPFAFSINTVPGSKNRPFSYGLGWFLGFSYGAHTATAAGGGGTYCLVSDGCANFAGDNYLLLKVNDYDCVTQTVAVYPEGLPAQENAITALAKLVLREPKNYMTFDDYASQHIKEVVFQNPRDLVRFHVQLLDAYGDPVDMCTAQFSFSIEALEVLNPSLYDTVRDSIMLRYV
jgi:hypothetical protein